MRRPDPARRAAALSFWLPGLGQLYRRRWGRGLAFLAASWWLTNAALAAWPPAAIWSCAAPTAPWCWTSLTALALLVWTAAVRDARSTQMNTENHG
jgi:hypothetical protein